MRIPLLSSCAESCYDSQWAGLLHARSPLPEPKGGGGGHGGSRGSSKSSKGSSTKSTPAVGSRGATVPISGTTFGSGKTTSTAYGSGGVKVTTIPQDQPFAGRTYGGATRGEIYGTSVYGSGYPGVFGSGVAGGNFPYIYPPVVWVDYGYGPPYLYSAHEYGEPRNTNRTGGPEMQAAFSSPSSNSTFHIIADNSTIVSLIGSIRANCSGKFSDNSSSASPAPYGSSATSDPRPEGAIQYYRASSVVLTLDGYNNTVALSSDPNANTKAVPLPPNVDLQLLGCLNSTIGEAVPLINSALGLSSPGMATTVGLMLVFLWHLV
ncbi:hypothetical protein GSI_14316 [Ganoderma sinense ZZ0214-1]|uniref:Uncharacterized protein n=1 Tax=Ganoderma sinense ZZ0214-1 TaxID=1077348 RepID=A0A2G8RNB9_9APHY|nr:hypothetical protein GSI_14316 [Ganoderma sinense ZZ0214-1]